MLQVPIKLLTKTARLPSRGTEFAAGLDLYADSYQVYYERDKLGDPEPELSLVGMNPGGLIIVNTGVSIAIPLGMVGIVHGRSGWAFKYDLTCANYGLIDSDYRGELKCLLRAPFTLISDQITLKQGDRVAQLLIQKYEALQPLSVKHLDSTERGEKGFGSTGI